MPPPLPSPTTSASQGRSTAAQARRSSIGVSQSRTSTPKQAVGNGSGGLKSAKVRGSSDKENGNGNGSGGGSTGAKSVARRGSSAKALAAREKIPSKDGTVQRNAKEVEGLKDYVRALPPTMSAPTLDKVTWVCIETLSQPWPSSPLEK